MKNIIPLILLTFIPSSIDYNVISPTASVCLVGGSIKADEPVIKKYKRKDCPVCKGKGWYISGDGIAKVDCGYCEPEQETSPSSKSKANGCKTEIIKR